MDPEQAVTEACWHASSASSGLLPAKLGRDRGGLRGGLKAVNNSLLVQTADALPFLDTTKQQTEL